MTISDLTPRGETGSLSLELDLPHPVEKVWRALTEPELLAEWMLPIVESRLELETGTTFMLQAPPQPGWDGGVHCRFLEIEAGRKLRYSWDVGELKTIVTFTLSPTAAGTRLTLVQSGFTPAQKRNFGGARYGWRMMSGRLVDLLERIA